VPGVGRLVLRFGLGRGKHAAMKRVYSLLPLSLLAFAAACAGEPTPCPKLPDASPVQTASIPGLPAAKEGAPTAAEAEAFMADVNANLKRLWIARDRAAWVNANFITDDTEILSAAGEEATAEYVTKAILAARRFSTLTLPPDLARQFYLLRLGQTVPAPTDAKERAELAQLQTQMGGIYGKGEYCPKADTKLAAFLAPPKGSKEPAKKCLKLDDLSRVLKTSRNYDELTEAWTGWHSISAPIREKYARYVELGNKGAKEIGFADMGALWRSGYDMTPEAFEADLERLWQQVKPLYDEIHCYSRMKLRAKYGKDKVAEHAPIPAQLLGNMWAQEWNNIYDLAEPYKGQVSLDVDKKLQAKKLSAEKMVRLGESFFTSMGFDALPKTFWERSLLTRPKDREVVCHASAWDVSWNNDLRIKMCVEPTEEELITIHHELGHNYYFNQYYTKPALFQQGANDGFHEGIGDTLALAVTPAYLKSIGLLDAVPSNPKAEVNFQMKQAIEKIAFLPFGLLIDKWRWDVFSGKTPKDQWNKSWWDLRTKYQGVSAPTARAEADFDPGAKYHIPGSTPYIRYFLARVYQFQFYRSLCEASGHKGPLHTCSFFGSKPAGDKLKAMLSLGASKPWPEAMKVITGQDKADASALIEYFAPLRGFLKSETAGEKCGW
jgi:peptidyl-dipeptidase A